jgi:hypothetical protein
MLHLTTVGAIHATLAMLCLAIGLIQLLRPKRGPAHRARGYAFAYAALVADGMAMLVYRFTGQFNIFHVGAIVNFAFVVLAIVPLLRTPRPANWKLQHYHFIAWSYVGLFAAAATELIVRVIRLETRDAAWAVTSLTAVTVTAIGYVLIRRYLPPSLPSPGDLIQRDGAPS